MTEATIAARLVELLEAIAPLKRPCRACGVMLYFIPHARTGTQIPYTAQGQNHFIDCPKAASFKRRQPEQQTLLGGGREYPD